jgi:hypothetical protein
VDFLRTRRLVLTVLVLPSLLAVLASACAGRPAQPSPGQGPDRYRFDVGVAPVPDRDRVLGGTVTATDLATRQAISTPRFEVAWGGTETVASEDRETKTRLKAKLTVDKAGTELVCEASVSRGGRPPVFHRSLLSLRN